MDSGRKTPLNPNPRSTSNLLSSLTFFWTIPIFCHGYRRDFEESDLFQPLKDHDSNILGGKLEEIWQNETKMAASQKKKPRLLKALLRCFGKEFLFCGICLALNEMFVRVAQPVFLGYLIDCFTAESKADMHEPYIYGGLVVLCSAVSVWVVHPYMLSILHLGMKVRVATCSLVYRKILRMNRVALNKTTPGQMVNLLSNDVNRFDTSTIFVHYLWLGPLQTFLITGLLIHEIGVVPAVVGVASLLMYIPLQGYCGKKASVFRLKVAVRTDERVRLMNEIISAIQVIKMYAWELPFQKMINYTRKSEMMQVVNSNYIRGLAVSFIIFAMRFSIFLTILTYVLESGTVSAKTVFIVTAYYNILRQNMTVFFPQGIAQLAEGLVSVNRLQDTMTQPELSNTSVRISGNEGDIAFSDAHAKWDPDMTEHVLSDLSLKISPGSLVAVVGSVGAGKSSFLNAILGELPIDTGSIHVGGSVSYAAQEPWLFAGTVRQNILFGEPMDPVRYKDVVRVCALRTDIAMFPQGDNTVVGERGVSLSGGQRARINLARALYRQADIYVFDDPLSAVDAHVSSHLFHDCISKFLSGKTRVLVTHQLQYLPFVNQVIVLNNGQLAAYGTYAEVKDMGLDSLLLATEKESDTSISSPFKRDSPSRSSIVSLTSSGHDSKRSSLAQSLIESEMGEAPAEEKAKGAVGWSVFSSYFRAAGNCCFIFIVMSMFLWSQLLASAGDYWITLWVKFEENDYPLLNTTQGLGALSPNWYEEWPPRRETCVYVYAAITVGTVVVTLARSFLFFYMCKKSSTRLHDNMFASITHAKMSFFSNNPSGRILNRFSKDIGAIDEVLPLCMIDSFQIGLTLLAIMVIVSFLNQWLIIPLVIISAISLWIRGVFMSTSRSIKRLEAVTRSPVFSFMNASLNGLATVRALKMETKLIQEFDSHQNLHSSAWYLFLATSRAFGYWLDQLCIVFITSVTFSFLIGKQYGIFGGDVGLAITQAITLTGMLQWGLRQEAEVENHMTSVERVIEYSNLPSEPPLEASPEKKPPTSWPSEGRIQFENVFLYYDPDDPPVLKNLSFTINPGERVGIVGRTGAGKSSLIAALFRLEVLKGRIIIDGVDTETIGIHDLRRVLSIIPQEACLFNATLRKNLDPFEEYPDDVLWAAIKEAELQEVVDEMGRGLQSQIHEGGANLSVGLRQLVCLARAIIRKNRILVLDEATANIDQLTDALIQKMIRLNFGTSTVLTIAHRLHTIMDYDKVLVMDAGTVVEFDHPHILLRNTGGVLYKMVQQVGGSAARKLISIAEESYGARSSGT